MSFAAFCSVQCDRIAVTLAALYCDIQRRRFVREWSAEKARMWAALESQIGHGIARDIRDWRVEP